MGHVPSKLFGDHFRATQTLDIRLHVVAYSVKQYTGIWLYHCLLHEFRNFFVCTVSALNYFLLVSHPSSHQILATPLVTGVVIVALWPALFTVQALCAYSH